MADVMDLPAEPSLREDRRKDRSVDVKDRGNDGRDRQTDSKERVIDDRRRDREIRESRERRDERLSQREERDDRPPRREHHERNSRHEERIVVSGMSEKKEREKDHKRRKSPSPPPYPHRFRDRHTLQIRRSPTYKRSRREDEHEAPRRGSPRSAGVMSTGDGLGRLSGFHGDQRYAYDGVSPYERMGPFAGRNSGSSHMGEERTHNRYPNFRLGPGGFHGGPPDWPGPGRTGFSDTPVSSNLAGSSGSREGLMSYKQFIQELEDDILPAEAERRYEEYKTEYISTQKRAFFEQNKDKDWLREKYDPSQLEGVLARRIENAKAASAEFLAELQAGTLDMGPNADGPRKLGANNDGGISEEDAAVSRRRRKSVKNSKDKDPDTVPKAPSIFSEPKRISKDIEQVQTLIRKLDSEKGIASNILTSSEQQSFDADRSMSGSSLGPIVIVRGANQVKGLEGLELLDVMLSYLWRVHGLDYYGMKELTEPPNGSRHVRTESKNGEDVSTTAAADWDKKLDAIWQRRLQSQDPVEDMLGKEKLEAAATEALDPLVRKIKDEKYGWKYGCGAKACSKLFHGPEYVHKHLKLKHPEIVNEVILKTREELYFQNYMNDPNAPIEAVSDKNRGQKKSLLGSSAPGGVFAADRAMVERSFAELGPSGLGRGPLRDGERLERGMARHERLEKTSRDEEMFAGVDRSPPRDNGPSSGIGPSYKVPSGPPETGGLMEPPLFDPFTGPAMRGPPFVSDLQPPPVLMPVPGAGPLGPFVPAPPEVAMRMWREQGGPQPFHLGAFDGGFDAERSGGSRVRRGRSSGHGVGPEMIDAPPMVMPVPPVLRHDPRHVRSYHDLDAPEDEVTVIDYRSL